MFKNKRVFATIIGIVIAAVLLGTGLGTFAYFSDTESSSGNQATGWTSWSWQQTTQGQFNAGLLDTAETATSPGEVKLSLPETGGAIVSQVFDSEGSGTRWDALAWDESLPSGTGIIFAVRASDTAFLRDAASPSWSAITYDTTPVPSGLPAGRYLQWKATLSTTADTVTPALSEVRVYYFNDSVTSSATPLTDIGNVSGTALVGQVLTAGAITPSGATVSYQWQRFSLSNGYYTDISGATAGTYGLIAADSGCYIRVMATGSGTYKCSVASADFGPIFTPITAIGAISGTVQVGSTLTAGALTPSGATATYQWQRCATVDGTYANISGATASTYTVTASDYTYYFKVVATGSGNYTGTVSSAATGQTAAGPLTAISAIIGTTQSGQTLTAGALTPTGATVTYQWQYSDQPNGIFDVISGATSNTYVLSGTNIGYYIRVVATGTGAYTGSVYATTVSPVTQSSTPITAMGVISGTAQVGQTLTAGTISPSGATVTYQWQRCATSGGTYENISGATASAYTLTGADYTYYIKVVATGSGTYTGTLTSAAVGPVALGQVTAIGAISGSTVVDETLTAGTLTPSNATVAYQWQRLVGESYVDISGATANTYTLVEADYGAYIKVVATGTGYYTGTVSATTASPVTHTITPITAIGVISGTAQVAQTLTAGSLTPPDATVTYQWQRCATSDGTYTNISGATANTYTLAAGDYTYYIKVVATGSGAYSGTVTSAYKGPVTAGPLTAIGAITGTTAPGQTLNAGALTPSGATATYQWARSDTGDGSTFEDIFGAISTSYTVQGSDSYRYIKVTATGTGAYTGTVSATTASRVSSSTTPITAIGAISGTAQVGQTLTAGALTPSGATATYQWQRCATAGGTYENISGATAGTYTLAAGDLAYYIKVVATGSGSYTGTVTSAATAQVAAGQVTAIGAISGTTVVGQTLTAGAITPSAATVSYQWQRATTLGGTYTNITGATTSTYTLGEGDNTYYIKVAATGTGGYTGTVTSAATSQVTGTSLLVTNIGTIGGTAQVAQTLTAGALTPSGATATYQWQKATASDGTYENIPGATAGTFTLTGAEYTYYIKVVATGSGAYSGTVTSAATAQVAACPITAIGAITGTTTPGQTLTAGALTPSGATVTYQWQYSDTGTGTVFTNIPGATANTYYIQNLEYSYRYLRVVATGSGAYTGSVYATTTSRVSSGSTAITAIGAITGTAQVAQTLTAGALTPSGATATYQWQKATTSGGTYTNISGATASTYTLTASEYTYYIKVSATGSGAYSGTVTSAATAQVAACPITAIGAITGSPEVGQTLTAGALTPSGATATYQWQKCATSGGTYENISGATASTFTLTAGEYGYYIKVSATGSGGYSGTVTSSYLSPTATAINAIGAISGTPQVGSTLTAGTLDPSGATATYQWQKCATADGTYTNISGATASTYTLTGADYTYYIKVVATGTGDYIGTATSAATAQVAACPITAIGAITGTLSVGGTLTAGAVTPSGATVTYQWQKSGSADGTYTNITGATASTYTLVQADKHDYIKVVATGTGGYTGTVTSAATGKVP